METIFECEFVPTVPMLANRNRKKKLVPYIIFLLFYIGIFLYAIDGVIKFGFNGAFLFCFVFACVCLVYVIFAPEIYAWRAVRRYRKDAAIYGPYRYAFGENIVGYQRNMQVIVEYSAIAKVEHLKYTYELVFDKNSVVAIDPNRFTKGSFAEFMQFLRAKRPDLQIPE